MDAIDGKQARRTNSNNPLGELFDHGCDALSTGWQDLFYLFFFHRSIKQLDFYQTVCSRL